MIGKSAKVIDFYEWGIFPEWRTDIIPTLSYDFFDYFSGSAPDKWEDIPKVKINWHDMERYIHCSPLSLYSYRKNHAPFDMIKTLKAYDQKISPPDADYINYKNYLVDRRYVVSTCQLAIYEVVGVWIHESQRKPWMPE